MESVQSMVVVAGRPLAITLYYVKNGDLGWFYIKPQNFKLNPDQIRRFPNQILVLQIKSLCATQWWFKSNNDLDLLITVLSSDVGTLQDLTKLLEIRRLLIHTETTGRHLDRGYHSGRGSAPEWERL